MGIPQTVPERIQESLQAIGRVPDPIGQSKRFPVGRSLVIPAEPFPGEPLGHLGETDQDHRPVIRGRPGQPFQEDLSLQGTGAVTESHVRDLVGQHPGQLGSISHREERSTGEEDRSSGQGEGIGSLLIDHMKAPANGPTFRRFPQEVPEAIDDLLDARDVHRRMVHQETGLGLFPDPPFFGIRQREHRQGIQDRPTRAGVTRGQQAKREKAQPSPGCPARLPVSLS